MRRFDFAGYFQRHRAPAYRDATLIRVAPGARTTNAAASGTNATRTSYPCKGFEASISKVEVDGDKVRATDRRIVLLGKSIADGAIEPTAADRVSLGGIEYAIRFVESSDSKAFFSLQARA